MDALDYRIPVLSPSTVFLILDYVRHSFRALLDFLLKPANPLLIAMGIARLRKLIGSSYWLESLLRVDFELLMNWDDRLNNCSVAFSGKPNTILGYSGDL